MYDLIIVGAGAAGLTAALTAKDNGINAALVEATDRIGKKLLVTGNGRCNISNKYIEYSRYHSDNNDFFKSVLNSYTYIDTENFFKALGLPLITFEDGKIFPYSLQASSVVDILKMSIEERQIPIHYNSKIKSVSYKNKVFSLTDNNDNSYKSKKLIIAAGGKSYVKSGSDGSGYTLAKSLGHKIITPIPALIQIKLDYPRLKALAGVKFDGYAEIIVNNTSMRKEFGEILFTDYGISGPPILQLSRSASYSFSKGKEVAIVVDMVPHISFENLKVFLENQWGTFSYRSVYNSLIGFLNKKLIPIILKEAGINDIHKPCFSLEWKEKELIYTLLKKWKFKVCGFNSFNNAQVTAGGVDTNDINPKTLESKLIPDLYFAGEVLDVDGDCGGFNLQWAWSSGFAAGKYASNI